MGADMGCMAVDKPAGVNMAAPVKLRVLDTDLPECGGRSNIGHSA